MSTGPTTPSPVALDELEVLRGLLTRRHSVRAYRPDPVPQELILEAVGVAARAPSWCNVQPWRLHVTEGDGTEQFRATLAAEFAMGGASSKQPDFPFPTAYTDVYRERRFETAMRLYDAVGVPRGNRAASARQTAQNFNLFGAPHVAILTSEANLGVYGAVDCGLFLGSLLVAFEAVGVAAIAQAAIALYSPRVREYFDIPDTRLVVCAISFGWEDTGHPANNFRTDRVTADEIVAWHPPGAGLSDKV